MSIFWVQVHNLIDMTELPAFHSYLSLPSSSTPLSNIHTLDIGAKEWVVAEEVVHEILSMIKPNVISERRRKEIIEYIQILVGRSYGIKAFPFGSVPLKTYLAHGDIDLTIVCHYDEELMLSALCNLLENEEMTNTEFQVRNVQYIPAQVKVVKCSVENISVDISFNQMAGLCALNFLEQVDQLIGKDHLFKCSVILIKSWCFYESRTLGALYGLISTYALEIMVIHIINLFHSTLCSPLAILYKFLRYYSKFDWDNYCLAINGVILISSLPEAEVQPPEGSDDPFLSVEFLQTCKEARSFATGINLAGQDQFNTKFLNIMDPLSSTNNLGRSVNQGSFYRIKCAFSYASEKLEEVFTLPVDKIGDGIAKIFKTTLELNGKTTHADVVPVQDLGDERSEASEISDENENLMSGIQYGLWCHDYGMYQDIMDPMSPQNSSLTSGEMSKSRGTGTYIPQPVNLAQWKFARCGRRPDSPRPSKPVPEEANKISLTEDGINRLLDFSLSEFPLLPGTKPVEIKNVNPTNFQSDLATESSLESVESGTSKTSKQVDSEWEAASPILQTPPSPDFLPVSDSPSSEQPLPVNQEKEKNAESPQNEVKRSLVEEAGMNKSPVRFGDPNEFPDLPILRLEDKNDFPDLPNLRLQDPKDFPPLSKKQQKGAAKKGRK